MIARDAHALRRCSPMMAVLRFLPLVTVGIAKTMGALRPIRPDRAAYQHPS